MVLNKYSFRFIFITFAVVQYCEHRHNTSQSHQKSRVQMLHSIKHHNKTNNANERIR